MRGRRSDDRGLALVTVLALMALLTVISAEFAFRVYLHAARSGNRAGAAQASILAEDGVTLATVAIERLLKSDRRLVMEDGGLSFTHLSGDYTMEIKATDERARIYAGVVYPATGLSNDRVDGEFRRLLTILDLDERLTEALADWIDADEVPRMDGAEGADHYRLKPKPYGPSNRIPAAVDELLLIKGFTPEVFARLSPYLTVHVRDGLVNINSAPKEVLMSLSPEMTPELAGRVIERRREMPFKDRSEIMKVPGFERIGFGLQDRITVESKVFRIRSVARSSAAVSEAEALVEIGRGVVLWRER